MGERLDLYIRTRGIDIGEKPLGLSVQPKGSGHPRTQGNPTSESSCTVAHVPKTNYKPTSGAGSSPPSSPSPPPVSPPLSPGHHSLPPESPLLPTESLDYEGTSGNPGPNPTMVTSGDALGTSDGSANQDSIQPNPVLEHPENLEDGDDPMIHMPSLQTTQCFIDSLCKASLAGSGMCHEDIENLHNPEQEIELVNPSPLLHSIRHFTNNTSALQEHYDTICKIELLNDPAANFLSFDQVKQHV